MQHDIIMNHSFSYQIKLWFYLKYIFFFVPIFRNIFFLLGTVIITERFNIHFSRVIWLVATFLPASFNGIRICSHMEKIKLFYIQCFFCRWWRKNEWLGVGNIMTYISEKPFNKNISVKIYILGTVIFLLERVYRVQQFADLANLCMLELQVCTHD